MLSASAILRQAIDFLHRSGVENPRLDAELLLAAAMERARLDIITHPEMILTREQQQRFNSLVQKRAQRCPPAYLIGYREFYGLRIAVSEGVLVPRQETETLVEQTIRRIGRRPATIADVGAGSGAIAVALAVNLPESTLYATEISPTAMQVARANLENHQLTPRVTLFEGDLVDPLRGLDIEFDAVVSNPPYVPSDVIPTLQPEISEWEPKEALDGGPDGLDVIRRLLPAARDILKPDGFVAFEVGRGQARAACKIARDAGYSATQIVHDLAGIERIVICER